MRMDLASFRPRVTTLVGTPHQACGFHLHACGLQVPANAVKLLH